MRLKVLIILMVLLSKIILGQTTYIKVGPVFSHLSWTNSMIEENTLSRGITGFNLLIGLKYLNLNFFNLNSSLGFIQKGGSGQATLTNELGDSIGTITQKEKLNYLTINTMVNLKFQFLKILEPYIFAGPRLDYLISYNENVGFIKQFDDAGKLNKLSYGFLFGVGVNVNMKKIFFGVSFDYYSNLNKIVDFTSNYGVTNKLSDRTFSLNALVGYKF